VGMHGGPHEGGPASYPVGDAESGFTSVSSTMTVPEMPAKLDGICYYIWTDIFFGDMSNGRMNQFVPQLILGNALDGSSGPPLYKPHFGEHRSYQFGAHYFFEVVNGPDPKPCLPLADCSRSYVLLLSDSTINAPCLRDIRKAGKPRRLRRHVSGKSWRGAGDELRCDAWKGRCWAGVDADNAGAGCDPQFTVHQFVRELGVPGVRVRVEIMESQNYENVGKSQCVRIMTDPIISTRTRSFLKMHAGADGSHSVCIVDGRSRCLAHEHSARGAAVHGARGIVEHAHDLLGCGGRCVFFG
jgi:hypothetical protein